MEKNSANTIHRWLNTVLNFNGLGKEIVAIEKLPEDGNGWRLETIAPHEHELIQRSISDNEINHLLEILLYEGMRVGTTIRLPLSAIDLTTGRITIPIEINKGKRHGYDI